MEHIGKNLNEEDIRIKSQMEKMVYTYDRYMKTVTFGREEKLRNLTVDLARIKQGDHVLEIGCATGSLTLAAKRKSGKNGRVAAIDIIPGMIEYSREKARKEDLDIDFQLASIDDIPFTHDQFDVVICSFMIFHMSNPVRNKGFEEIHRVLKNGGRLLIVDVVPPQYGLTRSIMKAFLGFMLKHELHELLPAIDTAGFKKTEIDIVKFRLLGLPLLSYLRAIK